MTVPDEVLQPMGAEMRSPAGSVLAQQREIEREADARHLRNPAPDTGRPLFETGGAPSPFAEGRAFEIDPVSGLPIS